MLYFRRLLRGGTQEALKSLEEHIKILKVGVSEYLSTEKYAHLGWEESANLSDAVLSRILIYESVNNKAAKYAENNRYNIIKECNCIKDDKRLCGKSGGISYLIAAEMYKYGIIARNPDLNTLVLHSTIRILILLNKHVSNYQLWIPGKAELGYSNDPWEVADNIGQFALKYVKEKVCLQPRLRK